ncbi:MAG TPA: hypothetical protein EYP61_06740 [Candidatus Latescibacteria bacterium]|nr:hypothetical protein [Candidatus Latescibacterota bacterium]
MGKDGDRPIIYPRLSLRPTTSYLEDFSLHRIRDFHELLKPHPCRGLELTEMVVIWLRKRRVDLVLVYLGHT